MQDATIAELQRTIAELRQELGERDAALAQRKTDFDERIEHQVATIDVLKAMSASPGDTQPVFDLIARSAAELCEARVGLWELREGQMHVAAHYGIHSALVEPLRRLFPRPADPSTVAGRAILERQVIHVRDVASDPMLSKAVRDLGGSAILGIPLLRDAESIGAIVLNGNPPGGFSASQVALLQTFAEQAVIAITSAETFRALQTRTGDLQESLEYQTATSDVLKVISRSTFDLQPVLDTVAETAARLCDADQALIATREGERVRMAANFGFPAEFWALWTARGPRPLVEIAMVVGPKTILEGRIVHIHDVAAARDYPVENIAIGRQRTTLGVPLVRDGETIGSIVLARQRVEPFTDRQIELVSTFADQAVIAIENTRLITEQREALEQQTATAEVLQVINASPGNLTPVFDAVLDRALRLCGASFGTLLTYDGEHLETVAFLASPPPSSNTASEIHSPRTPPWSRRALQPESLSRPRIL